MKAVLVCLLLIATPPKPQPVVPKCASPVPISIQWVDELRGNFSFRYRWNYPESVFKNRFGQLTCDGNCPPGIDVMKDDEGRIFKDSLKAFYAIVDTSHQYHSIACDAWCYEWAGTDYIDVIRDGDSIHCATACNMATHCSLHLDFVKDKCYPFIDLISIVNGGNAVYPCTGGNLKIDKTLWTKGIMKAEFSFHFEHKENPQQPIYWKGRIYTRMEKTNAK
jgi:hypothetical protein